jgi:flagellar biosynthesis chaperone FliJ
MKREPPLSVDLRGFAWPLAAAERLRRHQLDRAHAQVASLHRDQQACAHELESLHAARQQALRDLAPREGGRIETAARSQGFRHLHRKLSLQMKREQDASRVNADLRQAQSSCTQAQQRLDAVCRLRESALAAYVQDQVRRDAKNADLAWLATHGSGSPRQRRAEGGP